MSMTVHFETHLRKGKYTKLESSLFGIIPKWRRKSRQTSWDGLAKRSGWRVSPRGDFVHGRRPTPRTSPGMTVFNDHDHGQELWWQI